MGRQSLPEVAANLIERIAAIRLDYSAPESSPDLGKQLPLRAQSINSNGQLALYFLALTAHKSSASDCSFCLGRLNVNRNELVTVTVIVFTEMRKRLSKSSNTVD